MSEKEFIDDAATRTDKNIYCTEYATIIELSRLIKNLEQRVVALESTILKTSEEVIK